MDASEKVLGFISLAILINMIISGNAKGSAWHRMAVIHSQKCGIFFGRNPVKML